MTHGCLLRGQKCAVGHNHDVSSNVPARTIARLAPVEDSLGDAGGEIAEADKPREIRRANAFPLGECGKRHAVAAHECSVEPARPDHQLDQPRSGFAVANVASDSFCPEADLIRRLGLH